VSAVTRPWKASALLGALLALVLVPLLLARPASAARTITISVTANGPKPASAGAAVGDVVRFVNDDPTFVHQVANKSPNWRFDTGPLAPGQSFTTAALEKPGQYDYQGANLDTFTGQVVVPGSTTASPTAPPRSSSAPAPSGSSEASPSSSPSPSTVVVVPPPLAGGFGTIGVPPAPGSRVLPPAIAPNVAPTRSGESRASSQPDGGAVAIGSGRLPEPATGRRYGLPAALAVVASVGVASLLVRLLLAHPAARRPRGEVGVTVD